jgi:hypothetical protein
LIVVSNEERTEPFSASQFQPPSASRSPRIRSTIGDDVHPEVAAGLDRAAVDARLDLAVEIALALVLPLRVFGDERDGAGGAASDSGPTRTAARSQGVHGRRPR